MADGTDRPIASQTGAQPNNNIDPGAATHVAAHSLPRRPGELLLPAELCQTERRITAARF